MKTKKARRRGGTKDERRGIDIPLRRRRQYAIPSPPFGGSSMSIASSAGQPDSTALRAVPSVCPVVGKVVCRGGAATFPAHAVQRYNTLDFAEQRRVPTGASRPYWKPRAEGLAAPLDTPPFSRTRHVIRQARTTCRPSKMQNRRGTHPICRMDVASVLVRCGARDGSTRGEIKRFVIPPS